MNCWISIRNIFLFSFVNLRLQRQRPGGAMGVVVSYCCRRVQHVGPQDRRSGRSDSTWCSGSTRRLFYQRSPLGSLRRSLAEPEARAPTEAERQGEVGFPAGARQRGRPPAARTRRPSGPRDAHRARAGLVGCERLGWWGSVLLRRKRLGVACRCAHRPGGAAAPLCVACGEDPQPAPANGVPGGVLRAGGGSDAACLRMLAKVPTRAPRRMTRSRASWTWGHSIHYKNSPQ